MLAIKVQGDATLCTCCFVSFLPQSMTGVACMVLVVWLVKALPFLQAHAAVVGASPLVVDARGV